MEIKSLQTLAENPFVFMCLCLGIDIVLGDPAYSLHPIRVLGKLLSWVEKILRQWGGSGRIGGVMLFLILLGVFGGGTLVVRQLLTFVHPMLGLAWELYLGYSLLALGDLVTHGKRIARETLQGNLDAARQAASMLVGRDTDRMNFAACNRAAVESIAESLVDGVISPLFWFVCLGLPGMILFKIASTMDSMVGYKNERYLKFGWFGARLDDVMNFVPARLTWILITLFSVIGRGLSVTKAWNVGLTQHALLPGPNKGWSETAAAGSLGIRLAGPIYKHGILVNDLWIGQASDLEGGSEADVTRMITLAYGVTGFFVLLAGIGWRLGYFPFSFTE